jgi:hypothetical protein
MKKILIIASLFFSLSVFGQYDRAGVLISTSLGFSKTEGPQFGNSIFNSFNQFQNTSKTKKFTASPEFSYVVNKKFMIGLGYSFTQQSDVFDLVGTNQNGVFISNTIVTEATLSGLSLHMRYSQNILEKLIFSVKFTYYNLKGMNRLEDNNQFVNNQNQNRTNEFDVKQIHLSPCLNYFFGKSFGCFVETQGLEVQVSDSRKNLKEPDYNFDLNPQNWRIGFFYFIPTQKAIE